MAQKNPIKIRDTDVDIIFISKLFEMKNNSQCSIGYLDDIVRPLVLILPKMSEYVRTFKDKDGDKDNNNKLMSFWIVMKNCQKIL